MIHKKITSSLFAFTIAACSIQAAPATAIAKDAKLEQQVEATLSKMTLEEKIGQMNQIHFDKSLDSIKLISASVVVENQVSRLTSVSLTEIIIFIYQYVLN